MVQSAGNSMLDDEAATAPLEGEAGTSRSRLKSMFSRSKRKSRGESLTLSPPEAAATEADFPSAVAFNIPSGQKVKHPPPKLTAREHEEAEAARAAAEATPAGVGTVRAPPSTPPQLQMPTQGAQASLYPDLKPEVWPHPTPASSPMHRAFTFPRLHWLASVCCAARARGSWLHLCIFVQYGESAVWQSCLQPLKIAQMGDGG